MEDKDIEELANEFADYWNTRIIREHVIYHFKNGDVSDEYCFGVHEVYYDKENKPAAWSKEAIRVWFYEPEDLVDVLRQINDATQRTVLELETIDNKHGDLIDSGKMLSDFQNDENMKLFES